MNCESCQQGMVEYLLGELDRAAVDQIDQHLASDCASCKAEWRDLKDSIEWLVATRDRPAGEVAPHTRDAIWRNIQTQIQRPVDRDFCGDSDALEGAAVAAETDPPTSTTSAATIDGRSTFHRSLRNWAASAVAIAAGFAFATLAIRVVDPRHRDTPPAVSNLAAPAPTAQPVQVIALHEAEGADTKTGTLIYDAATHQVHFYTTGLTPPKPGEHYSFWFVTTDQQWRLGGRVNIEAGVVGQIFELPETDRPIAYAAVTLDSDSTPAGTRGSVALTSDTLEPRDPSPTDESTSTDSRPGGDAPPDGVD